MTEEVIVLPTPTTYQGLVISEVLEKNQLNPAMPSSDSSYRCGSFVYTIGDEIVVPDHIKPEIAEIKQDHIVLQTTLQSLFLSVSEASVNINESLHARFTAYVKAQYAFMVKIELLLAKIQHFLRYSLPIKLNVASDPPTVVVKKADTVNLPIATVKDISEKTGYAAKVKDMLELAKLCGTVYEFSIGEWINFGAPFVVVKTPSVVTAKAIEFVISTLLNKPLFKETVYTVSKENNTTQIRTLPTMFYAATKNLCIFVNLSARYRHADASPVNEVDVMIKAIQKIGVNDIIEYGVIKHVQGLPSKDISTTDEMTNAVGFMISRTSVESSSAHTDTYIIEQIVNVQTLATKIKPSYQLKNIIPNSLFTAEMLQEVITTAKKVS